MALSSVIIIEVMLTERAALTNEAVAMEVSSLRLISFLFFGSTAVTVCIIWRLYLITLTVVLAAVCVSGTVIV